VVRSIARSPVAITAGTQGRSRRPYKAEASISADYPGGTANQAGGRSTYEPDFKRVPLHESVWHPPPVCVNHFVISSPRLR
jgi:hypothetical protein